MTSLRLCDRVKTARMNLQLVTISRFSKAMREFADGEIAPGAAERDEQARFPSELIPKLAEQGLLGIMVPEEYGGAGYDAISAPSSSKRSRASTRRSRCWSARTTRCARATSCWPAPTIRSARFCRRSRAARSSAHGRSPSRDRARTPAPCARAPRSKAITG